MAVAGIAPTSPLARLYLDSFVTNNGLPTYFGPMTDQGETMNNTAVAAPPPTPIKASRAACSSIRWSILLAIVVGVGLGIFAKDVAKMLARSVICTSSSSR